MSETSFCSYRNKGKQATIKFNITTSDSNCQKTTCQKVVDHRNAFFADKVRHGTFRKSKQNLSTK